jgi:gamma-polyglutamate synthase
VAVAGSRGKSGVTRLVAAGLRESGLRVLAKTTGSKPVLILPDGTEEEVLRPGPASIREQIRLVSLAARSGADVLVAEIMSIGAECLATEARRILRPGTIVLTNVKLDHLEAMGRCKKDIARVLSSAIAERADLFLPEEEAYPVFAETAARSEARLHSVGVPDPAQGRSFLPREHEPNIRLALAVCASLGVDRETALRGMAKARPDFGSLKIWHGLFGDPPRPAVCVSAFAANEPESSAAALELAEKSVPPGPRPRVGLLSLREDRGDRTLQWVRAAVGGFFRAFSAVVLIGPPARAALRKIRHQGIPGPTVLSSAGGESPEELMNRIFSLMPDEPYVVGFGNIVGPGDDIVRYWDRKGTVHDR